MFVIFPSAAATREFFYGGNSKNDVTSFTNDQPINQPNTQQSN